MIGLTPSRGQKPGLETAEAPQEGVSRVGPQPGQSEEQSPLPVAEASLDLLSDDHHKAWTSQGENDTHLPPLRTALCSRATVGSPAWHPAGQGGPATPTLCRPLRTVLTAQVAFIQETGKWDPIQLSSFCLSLRLRVKGDPARVGGSLSPGRQGHWLVCGAFFMRGRPGRRPHP